ncbi:MAG: PQQ-binding-like beta-propeller repeat protein [candidate division KSB1 bacterium]|nr:PQQ-binding-like beta-propeller repeat protein [candidate division KSB1 bacterium]
MNARRVLLCALLLGLACARHPQGAVYVGSTDKLVFGFDENGRVLWKSSLGGFRAWKFSDSMWLAHSIDPPILVALEPKTGKELWRWSAEGLLVGVGGDSIPPDCTLVACTVETATEMVHVRLHPETGQVLASWSRPNELPWRQPRPGAMCSAEGLQKLIAVVFSSSSAFGFDENAKMVWRLPFRPEENPCHLDPRLVILRTEMGLRVVDRQTGTVLWERQYPSSIEFVSAGRDYVQATLADGTCRLYEAVTGKPYQPKEVGVAVRP